MKRSWISILLVVLLLGLLGLLASMQYRWFAQFSKSEGERLQKRLETDTQRFAEDFNREIQSAYFSFQTGADLWRESNYAEFAERYQAWREQAAYPALIKDFYFARNDQLLKFDANKKTFNSTEWTEDLGALRRNFQSGEEFELIDDRNLILVMPVYEEPDKILVSQSKIPVPMPPPAKFGFLVIKLDENVIKNELLPSLSRKYFSGSESATYNLAVVSQTDENRVVFSSGHSGEIVRKSADASVPLFNLSPDNFAVFVNRDLLSKIRSKNPETNLIINQRVEKHQMPTEVKIPDKPNILKFETFANGKPRIFRGSNLNDKGGRWLLNVQHTDGSLEKFITNTRNRNLALSFGILLVLAASVVLIFLSARRAQLLAQRQMDFVSAVSHEFRTPLAVIYSAGENLTDGIVSSGKQVEQYGNLIKREGKKLTAMVEQILEFAGARSGQKKYDLRPTSVRSVVENALGECQSLIKEKDFIVESEIAENLPEISADANALSHTIQNLITNAVKYSNGNRWIKVSAFNGDGQVKIAVEDKGIGISPKDRSNIFTPFYRSKSVVDAQIHGNGLGLSLVKQTVKAHDGKISVESEIGKGSKFTIHLPVNI
jgi:signal transduction histidine kinase